MQLLEVATWSLLDMSAKIREPSSSNVIGMRNRGVFGLEFIIQELGESSF